MEHNGYTNEHGIAGMHRAYGILMSYQFIKEKTQYSFDCQMQKMGSNMYRFMPLVQVIDTDGIVQECQITLASKSGIGPPYENTIELSFEPEFTGWVIAVGRIFNCLLADPDNSGVPVYGTSFSLNHGLDAPVFCQVTDEFCNIVGSEIQLVDDDNLAIGLGSDKNVFYSLHGLRAPMCRKYPISISGSPYKSTIYHYLGTSGVMRPPYVMIVDDSGYVAECQIKHLNLDSIELEFNKAFTGNCYLLMG